MVIRNGLVDTLSYRLCFTYSRMTYAAFSIRCNQFNSNQLIQNRNSNSINAFDAYHKSLVRHAVRGIGKVPPEQFHSIGLFFQWQAVVMDDKHLDHHRPFLRFGAGHLEEACAAHAAHLEIGKERLSTHINMNQPQLRLPNIELQVRLKRSRQVVFDGIIDRRGIQRRQLVAHDQNMMGSPFQLLKMSTGKQRI